MKIEQKTLTRAMGWEPEPPGRLGESAQLVLTFCATPILKEQKPLQEIKRTYPKAHLLGCSTAGEICGTQVHDDSLVATAIHFEYTQIIGAQTKINHIEDSFQADERPSTSSVSREG